MTTIGEIKARNDALGHFFFQDQNMDWFASVVYDDVVSDENYDYFITSEQDPSGMAWDGERRWSIRAADPEGRIITISEFGQYESYTDALAALNTHQGE